MILNIMKKAYNVKRELLYNAKSAQCSAFCVSESMCPLKDSNL